MVLLSLFPNIKLIYVSPAGLEMPEEIKHEVKERGIEEQITNLSLQEVTDFHLYLTYNSSIFKRLLESLTCYMLREFKKRDLLVKRNMTVSVALTVLMSI